MKRIHTSKQGSLWQSAVDRVVNSAPPPSAAAEFSDTPAPPPTGRFDPTGDDAAMMDAATAIATDLDNGKAIPIPPPPSEAAGLGETVEFCSKTAFRIAEARAKSIFTGNTTELKALQEEIGAKFGGCDPRWTEVIAEYVKTRVGSVHIPYRHYNQIGDFVISGPRFPDNARIAIVGDWGTGQDAARGVLQRIAARDPDVVIHLGDVYYSGTDDEFQKYFYPIWRDELNLENVPWGGKPADPDKRPSTFTLAGNHDMYAGGGPYYTQIDMLGQPASYFCLRNSQWQFIALDTGQFDANPTAAGGNVTRLDPLEVAWVKDKIQNAGGRKTVLLSHHQLYTAFESEKIGDGFVNQNLLGALKDVLAQVTVWFWGHEHNMVIFQKNQTLPGFSSVLGRCIGHGAFPVGRDELGKLLAGVNLENAKLALDSKGGLFQNGYTMMQLNGAGAEAVYYQYDAFTKQEKELFRETL